VAEFGAGLLWGLFGLMNFFPPSGHALAPWLVGPMSGLASLHFMWRAFDSRPRLIVDAEGVTDRTALVGGPLFVSWSDILDVSVSKRAGTVDLEVRDVAAVRRRAGILRRIWMTMGRAFGMGPVCISPTLLGVRKRDLKEWIEVGLFEFERRDLGMAAGTRRVSGPERLGG